jgi:hypothetical protein
MFGRSCVGRTERLGGSAVRTEEVVLEERRRLCSIFKSLFNEVARHTRSSRNKFQHLLSFRRFILYGQSCRKYEIIVLKFSGPFCSTYMLINGKTRIKFLQ